MKERDRPVWKRFKSLRKRLRAAVGLRYPASAKYLELIKNVVHEQFPQDREELLKALQTPQAEQKKKKLRRTKIRRFSVNAKATKESKRPRRSAKRSTASKKHPSSH